MKEISFLIGSGFSVPDGLMSVTMLNETIKNLTVDKIYIHTDLTFHLVDTSDKPSLLLREKDEAFFIEFIQWYIQKNSGIFNYEVFYDFVSSYQRFNKHKEEVDAFFYVFKHVNLPGNSLIDNPRNYISRFTDYFKSLISDLLHSNIYYENVSHGNYPPYEDFAQFLSTLVQQGYLIHIHSLNHDLLFEHIASKHADLWQYFTDGYSDKGSNYYGRVHLHNTIVKTY